MGSDRAGDILVIDDDPGIIDFIVEALTDEGYAVRSAYNGTEGLMAIMTAPPGLLLLDLLMPGLFGGDLLAQIRSLHPHLPVVLITATPQLAESLIDKYQVMCLPKPFALDALLSCVTQYIGPPLGQ